MDVGYIIGKFLTKATQENTKDIIPNLRENHISVELRLNSVIMTILDKILEISHWYISIWN